MKQKKIIHTLIKMMPILGSIIIAIGVFLPWITFLAGIQTFTGFVGQNGKILFVSSIITLLLSIFYLKRATAILQWFLGGVGFLQLAFCSYLIINVWRTYQQLTQDGMNSMTAPGVGIGIFITELGALFVFSVFFFTQKKVQKNNSQ